MAKLADYYICDLRYTKEGYVIIDEDNLYPCISEDNDEYIKEYWGDFPFIGKFPVMYRGKLVDALVFKDYEQYFGVFKDEGLHSSERLRMRTRQETRSCRTIRY